MRHLKVCTLLVAAALLSVFMIGCSCLGDDEGCGDCIGPAVTFVSPANLAVNVPINTALTATFSKAMSPATLNTLTFTLDRGAIPVTGTVAYAGLTATFTPAAPLLPNTVYTATITTGAKDLAGRPIANNYVWVFTTGAAPDITAPTVTFVSPANLAVNVPNNTAVTATFSEAMLPATISTVTFTLDQGALPIAGTVVYAGLTATFTPAAPLLFNTVYTATITTGAQDLAGNALANNFVWTFTTGAAPDTTPPTVTFVSPANLAANVPVNTAVTATFSEAMLPATISTATFTLYNGIVPVTGTVVYAGLTATFTPSVPLLFNTVYTATITTGAEDLAGNALANNFVWAFTTGAAPDTTAPTVTFISPANFATNVPVNTALTATFSEAMDPTTINTATFTLDQFGLPVTGTVVYAGLTATLTPSVPLLFNTNYTARVTLGAEDLAGNTLASDFVWTFTTGAAPDTTAPTVTFVSPANLATNVPVNTAVAATFSEAMDPTTISTTTFTLYNGIVPVTGTVVYAGLTATFTPSVPLLFNTVYTATVTTGAEDLAGNALANDYIWTFTTGAAPDTTAPTVTFVSPANLATNVPVNTAVTATFSEAMLPATISTTTFTLYNGIVPVTGTVVYAGLTATFTPSAPLLFNTVYTATITTGAEDLAGNALANDYVWTFTTGAAPDITAPTVILVNPADLATNVSVNTSVNATFSEIMDPTTINTSSFTLYDGITPVTGTVVYVGLSATFTPSAPLLFNTVYTATITTGAKDLAGNALVSDYVWTFTTGAATYPAPVFLGAADNFVALSGSGISNIPTSFIIGDIGVSPATGSTITGLSAPLTCPEVVGSVYAVDAAGPACAIIDPAGLTAAKAALTVAFNDAAGRTVPAPATISGDQGGVTLPPGIYKSTSSLTIASGNLTLDAQGDANAVWVFQIASTLTTVGCGASVPCATGGNVMLINGADPANIFWQVGTAATIGQFTAFEGTILANDDISIDTGAQVTGRLLSGAQPSGSGAITLISNTLVIP